MKKLLALGMSILLIGCSDSPKNEKGVLLAEKDGNEYSLTLSGTRLYLRYVQIDEHEYLWMRGPYMGSITHSPKCPCLNNKIVFVIDQNQDIQFPNIGVELVNTYINSVTNKVIEN